MVGYRMVQKNYDDMFSRFHTIPACEGRTDRQTELLYQYRASVCWRAIKNRPLDPNYAPWVFLSSMRRDLSRSIRIPNLNFVSFTHSKFLEGLKFKNSALNPDHVPFGGILSSDMPPAVIAYSRSSLLSLRSAATPHVSADLLQLVRHHDLHPHAYADDMQIYGFCDPPDTNALSERLSLIHIWRCRRSTLCRSRWSPYH